MVTCETCGNEFPDGRAQCPFCGSHRQFRADNRTRPRTGRTVSLKEGLPTVEEALKRLRRELDVARSCPGGVVKFVHGYGSSGQGGAIRTAVRRALVGEQQHGRVKAWIPGEETVQRVDELASILKQVPRLREDLDTRRSNEGITWVLL